MDTDTYDYQTSIFEGMLGLDSFDKAAEITYTAKKDIKVASAKAVSEYLISTLGNDKVYMYGERLRRSYVRMADEMLDMYGKAKLSDLIPVSINSIDLSELLENATTFKRRDVFDDEDMKTLTWLSSAVEKSNNILRTVGDTILMDERKSKAFFEHFKSKGYDAIIDIGDYSTVFKYPLVILDPSETLNQTDVRKY